jgi:hypothetical protein
MTATEIKQGYPEPVDAERERHLQALLSEWRRKYGVGDDYAPTHWVVAYQWFRHFACGNLRALGRLGTLFDPSYNGLPFIFDSRVPEPRLARLESL